MLKSGCKVYVEPGMCCCRRGHWHGLCQPHHCKELQVGSDRPNCPCLYSPPSVLYCTLCPGHPHPKGRRLSKAVAFCAGLCLPHFHVITWTGLLSPGSEAVAEPLLCPPAHFWWVCSCHRHGTGGSWMISEVPSKSNLEFQG